jgi:hypothetical protein
MKTENEYGLLKINLILWGKTIIMKYMEDSGTSVVQATWQTTKKQMGLISF